MRTLNTVATPNGMRASIALEECGIDSHLSERDYIVGNAYSLADVMMYPTAAVSVLRLSQGIGSYSNIERWSRPIGEREAVQKGMKASS